MADTVVLADTEGMAVLVDITEGTAVLADMEGMAALADTEAGSVSGYGRVRVVMAAGGAV